MAATDIPAILPAPEHLFHTTLTVGSPQAADSTFYVLGTHSELGAAKRFAAVALESLNYTPEDFASYEVYTPGAEWSHGDGSVVFATAANGKQLLVGLATTPNNLGLAAGPDGGVVLPANVDHLHYLLQTMTDYNRDRSGSSRSTELEGCYLHRADAIAAAEACLVAPGVEFAHLDKRSSADSDGEWPFGDNVVVHAVSYTGENIVVSVQTTPDAHRKHCIKH